MMKLRTPIMSCPGCGLFCRFGLEQAKRPVAAFSGIRSGWILPVALLIALVYPSR